MSEMTPRLRAFLDKVIANSPTEVEIVLRVVRAMREAGNPVVSVWDGEERTAATREQDIIDLVFNLDIAYLETTSGDWVMIVPGNKWDALADHTVYLEDALAPVDAWIEKNR